MRRPIAAVLAVAALAVAHPAAPASACTRVLTVYAGEPAAGAAEVPTNAVPWLWVNGDADAVTVQLTDSTGMLVDAEIERLEGYVLAGYLVIRPRAELGPNSFYDVLVDGAATSTGESFYRFTTGPGPVTGTPAALGDLQMQVADNGLVSCGDNSFACVGVDHAGVVQLTVTDGMGAVEAELIAPIDGALRYVRTPLTAESPFCLELRSRHITGQLGPPSRLCSSDAPLFAIETTNPVTCTGHRVVHDERFADGADAGPAPEDGGPGRSPPSDDRGCSATGAPHGAAVRSGPGPAALALAFALLLVLAGRRRPRPPTARRAPGARPRGAGRSAPACPGPRSRP